MGALAVGCGPAGGLTRQFITLRGGGGGLAARGNIAGSAWRAAPSYGLGGPNQGGRCAPMFSHAMATFLFRCPRRAIAMQGWAADDETDDADAR